MSALLVMPPGQAAPEDLPGRLILWHATITGNEVVADEWVTTSPTGADESPLIDPGPGEQVDGVSSFDATADGSRIAFQGWKNDSSPFSIHIWSMDADGNDLQQLTEGATEDMAPTWSPDGATIAFLRRNPATLRSDIWLMAADGTDQRVLLTWPSELPRAIGLDWSPDGQTLLAVPFEGLYAVDVDVPEPELLYTATPGSEIPPQSVRWSPDGSAIVVVEYQDYLGDVVLVDPEDGSALNLTNTPGRSEDRAVWSPDGTALAWNQVDLDEEDQTEVPTGVWVHEIASGTTTQVIPIDPDTQRYDLGGWIPDGYVDPDGVDTEVEAGGTVGTDPEEDGATAEDPVETSVTTPSAGTVTIDEHEVTGSPPSGYLFFGQEVSITAPPASPAAPLVIVFRVDPTVLPEGVEPDSLFPFRNGVPVPPCFGAPGTAEPDPCRQPTVVDDGDFVITVLTSAASTWNLGVSTVPPDTTPPAIALVTPAAGATYGRDQAVVAAYSCTDAESGVADCTGARPSGSLVPTTSLGWSTFRVDATDVAGNAAAASATYRVVSRRLVVPAVTCVIRGSGGWWTARFGYDNRNAYRVHLPVGTRNGFTSAPVDRGQPVVFNAGRVARAVEVAFRTTVAWRLDGTTVTARTTGRRC